MLSQSRLVSSLAAILLLSIVYVDLSSSRIVVAQTKSDRVAEGNRLIQQGFQQYRSGQYKNAIQTWQQALEICQALNDRNAEAEILINLGTVYSALYRYEQSLAQFQKSLVIFQELNNPKGVARVLASQATIYTRRGQFQNAIELIQRALPIFEKLHYELGIASALGNQGSIYDDSGQYQKALELSQQALAIFQKINNPEGIANELANLGGTYRKLGQYDKAIKFHQQALEQFQKLGNPQAIAQQLMNTGVIYSDIGKYADALDFLNRALIISKQNSDSNTVAQNLINQANVYSELAQYDKMLSLTQQATSIFQTLDHPLELANALTAQGSAYNYLNQNRNAITVYEEAFEIYEKLGNEIGKAKVLSNQGNVYKNSGQYSEAIDHYQKALVISRKQGDAEAEASTLVVQANAYKDLGQYNQSISLHQQALAIYQHINKPNGISFALNGLGVALFHAGRLPEAEATLYRGLHILETLRDGAGQQDDFQISIFQQQMRTYRSLQKVLIAENKNEQALEISERGRARASIRLLNQRLFNDPKFPLEQIPTLDHLKQTAKEQQATLVEYSIIYENNDAAGTVNDKNLYIWVVRPTGEVQFRKVDLETQVNYLEAVVTSARSAIGVINPLDRAGAHATHAPNILQLDKEKQSEQLQKLHKLLIDPISDLLPTDPSQNVIFIPQGALFSVPFPALKDADGKYLIEKHTILTAPSIQMLDLTRQQRNKLSQSGSALVLGNPTMPIVTDPRDPQRQEQLPSLAGAETEANEIAPLLHATAITGSQGTKANIQKQMQQARIIHLATHGLLDDVRGLGSAIALAPDHPGTLNDGLLTAEEILQMKLNAELVVLSACDTGRGKITGDGVIGLSRALIAAGVSSVIVSLWSIPDAPTAELMTEFYKHLNQNPNKAQALRQAMLATLRTHPNPRDWAAFTLIGEAQ